jgi:hypothetical protein
MRPFLVLLLLLAACSGAESSQLLVARDETAAAPAFGTCTFTLDEPAGSRSFTLPGYVSMRGNDLEAHCSSEGRSLEVCFGDPDYRGPGDYVVDRKTRGGSVSLYDGDVHYSSSSSVYATTACRLAIVEGPAVAVAPGDRVRGTFECVDMRVEEGFFNSVLRGRAQLRNGSFDLAVP